MGVLRGAKHPNWKGDNAGDGSKRRRIRKLVVLGACDRCGKPAIDRHHRDGDTGNNVSANLGLLCRRCHMLEDGRLAAFMVWAKAPKTKPLSPCSNCTSTDGYKRQGRCGACAAYFRRTGHERPTGC